MKPALVIAALLLAAPGLFAQGTLFFYNHVPEAGLDAPVFDTDGKTLLQGYQFQAQLFAGAAASSLSAVGPVANFSLTPGYWTSWNESLDRIIPDAAPGASAFCQVKVWSFFRGGSYDQVEAAGGKHGQSDIFSVATGGASGNGAEPPGFPAYLTGLKSFSLTGTDPVPEPRTLVLLALGLALIVRIQNQRQQNPD